MTDIRTRGATLRDVSYQYPATPEPALEDVSLRIDEGSFLVITGMSGSGKSTLLRVLNGLIPHFTGGRFGGKVEVAGWDTQTTPTRVLARHAGFVFQDPDSQAFRGRVDDEVAFGLEQLGVPVSVMRRQVEEALELVGIGHLRSRNVSTLSGGERQRVAIAASLAMGPNLLILDEPTSQLDPAGAEDVFQTLHRLNDELGMTIVLSEHRLERVIQHADRIRILRPGHSAVDGPPREVLTGEGSFLATSLMRAGGLLGWKPVPMSVREGRRRLHESGMTVPTDSLEKAAPAGPLVLELRDVELRHDGTKVLEHVEFDVHEGEVVALMGANGSGKTTLLRAIAGLHPARRGQIRLKGVPVAGMPASEIGKEIGFLPQRARALLFTASVREEVAFSLNHRNRVEADPVELLDEFGLSGLADHHPLDLSSGEQERLALAATLAGNPPLLLLDEPTRGLDALRKEALASSIRRRARAGASIVLATHDVDLAATVADRIVLLGGGRIIAVGTPRSVLGESLVYGTQINKVFGGGLLTVNDVATAFRRSEFDDNQQTPG